MCMYAVADPDLPIKGWGSGGVSKKLFFQPFWPQFGLKIQWGWGRGGGGQAPALDPPVTCTCMLWEYAFRTAAT